MGRRGREERAGGGWAAAAAARPEGELDPARGE